MALKSSSKCNYKPYWLLKEKEKKKKKQLLLLAQVGVILHVGQERPLAFLLQHQVIGSSSV